MPLIKCIHVWVQCLGCSKFFRTTTEPFLVHTCCIVVYFYCPVSEVWSCCFISFFYQNLIISSFFAFSIISFPSISSSFLFNNHSSLPFFWLLYFTAPPSNPHPMRFPPFSINIPSFPAAVSSPVELLISQTLCWVHDDLDQVDFSSYLLKVCGREEVLQKWVHYTRMWKVHYRNW